MEMALSSELTLSQATFCDLVASGVDKDEAAERAGYGIGNPRAEASRLLQQPMILATIQIAVARQLSVGAGAAVKVLQDFLVDEKVDKRLRVVCAKTLLDRAGHIAPKAVAPGAAGAVPLNEMSMADLRALADKLEGELATRAKPVSSAKPAPSNAQTLDDIM